jgi:signal transduction histidine kinase
MRHLTAVPFLRLLGFVLGLLLWAGTVHADELKLETSPKSPIVLSPFMGVHEDKTGSLDVSQVLQAARKDPDFFRPAGSAGSLPAYSASTWWLQLDIMNTGATQRHVAITPGPPDIEYADFYLYQEGVWRHTVTGSSIPNSEQSGLWLHPAVFFILRPGEQVRLILRLRTDTLTGVGPVLYSKRSYVQLRSRIIVRDSIYLGAIAALACFSLLAALINKRVSFVLLALFAACSALNEAAIRGYAQGLLWGEVPDWGYRGEIVLRSWAIALFGCAICSIANSRTLKLPGARALLAITSILVCIAIAAPFADAHVITLLVLLGTVVLTACMLCSTSLLIQDAPVPATLMGASSLLVFLGACLQTLGSIGGDPSAPVPGSSSLGTPAGALALGLSLAALTAWSNLASQRQRKHRQHGEHRLKYHARLRLGLSLDGASAVARRAEVKARQKTQIMGYLGHDLRAPLANLAGYMKLLRRSCTPEQEQHLQAMERSVGYQFDLIEEMLSYAKAELQPFTLNPKTTSLPGLLQEIAHFGNTLCADSGNVFHFLPPRIGPAHVYVDALRLRQALLNLLSNAAQFTRDGVITLSVQAQGRSSGWQLGFTISDDGAGIAPEKHAGIFNAFEQARHSPGGAGLGLFIVERIVGGMGGELTFDSLPGKGATFMFSVILPCTDNRVVAIKRLRRESAYDQIHAVDTTAPPLMTRLQLVRLAHNGEVSDIEHWLLQTATSYPQCGGFLREIRQAFSNFDLARVRKLALMGSTAHAVSDSGI